MPYTQADIDALKARMKAFAGVSQTTIADQSTSFDLEAAERLLARMEREVNGVPARTRYASTRKGV